MRSLTSILLLIFLPVLEAQAEACLVYLQALNSPESTRIRCQQNRNIPAALFRSGFCQTPPEGHRATTRLLEHCPEDFLASCRNARVSNLPYRQDILYYRSTQLISAQRACQQQEGQWQTTQP